jgi:FHS family L-fucose permease-like MFS transporter
MGIVGGAVFTPLMGLVAINSMALAMLLPLGCYFVVTVYAFWWSVPKKLPNSEILNETEILTH